MPNESNESNEPTVHTLSEPSPPSAAGITLRLAIAFLIPFGMNACVWFSSDFHRFVPPSDGRFAERLSLTLWSALGPLAFGLKRRSDGWGFADLRHDGGWSLFFAGVLMAAVVAAFRFRRHAFWRALGYVAMLVWIGFGCGRTSLRIT